MSRQYRSSVGFKHLISTYYINNERSSIMTLDGEITEITSPPNKADRFRGITIWVPATEEHTEITLPVEDFKKAGLAEGDQIAIKLEKKFDIDAMAQDLFKGKL